MKLSPACYSFLFHRVYRVTWKERRQWNWGSRAGRAGLWGKAGPHSALTPWLYRCLFRAGRGLESEVVLKPVHKYTNSLKSPLEIKPVNPKGNKSWIFIRRTDAEIEVPILWPLDGKNWLIRKDPDAGNDWRQEEKGTTEDEMVGWHNWLNGHEFEQAPGDGDEQGNHEVAMSQTQLGNWTTTRWSSPARRILLLAGF